jgi:hypothetical protein
LEIADLEMHAQSSSSVVVHHLVGIVQQKGVYYYVIKLFNNLPPNDKSLNHDTKMFKPALKEYLLSHSIYFLQEFTSTKNSQVSEMI